MKKFLNKIPNETSSEGEFVACIEAHLAEIKQSMADHREKFDRNTDELMKDSGKSYDAKTKNIIKLTFPRYLNNLNVLSPC